MEVASDVRSWDELIPDTLGVIFAKLSIQERLTVIPRVCKSWARAVTGPYCWQEIDIDDWSSFCEPQHIERMVEMLITRSSGSLRKLSVSGLQTERIFNFIAENAGSLRNLRMIRCNMSNHVVEKMSGRLSRISVLDLSYCMQIGDEGIKIIGKNCKQLEVFCRNMHPLDTSGEPLDDAEAFAIATNMPKLRHLEMAYHLISNDGVHQILSSCMKLEHLDLRGCWGVQLDNMSLNQKFPNLKILGPHVLGWDDSSDISDSSSDYADSDTDEYDDESDDDMWYDGIRIEGLELRVRVYVGIEDAGMHWPASP